MRSRGPVPSIGSSKSARRPWRVTSTESPTPAECRPRSVKTVAHRGRTTQLAYVARGRSVVVLVACQREGGEPCLCSKSAALTGPAVSPCAGTAARTGNQAVGRVKVSPVRAQTPRKHQTLRRRDRRCVRRQTRLRDAYRSVRIPSAGNESQHDMCSTRPLPHTCRRALARIEKAVERRT